MFSLEHKYAFSFPTDIRFGVGTRRDVAPELKRHDLKRPLVVTDKGLRDNTMVTALLAMMTEGGLSASLFSDFSGNPVESHVTLGAQAFRDHQADSVVAIGGGAALDVAKAIALMSCHEGSILDYCDDAANHRKITNPLPFFVAIATTSGTGSEVGRSTVVSDEKTHEKKVIFHPSMLAKLVILDPELALNMPASITAATGMDALSHLVESYLAKDFHPVCDAIALHGISILKDALPACYKIASKKEYVERDFQARGAMMLAAMMGAIAFQKGLGVTHSCAHALSSVCNTHHGLANGVMLPFAMAFNAAHAPDRFVQIAQALSLRELSAESVIEWMCNLQKTLDVPQKLSLIGVTQDHIQDLADFAIKDGCHLSNAVPVTRSDFVDIFKAAL